MIKRAAILLSGAAILAVSAQAQIIKEARIGVMQHNICVIDCNNADKEDGPNINGEIVFGSPDIFRHIFSPRPYVMASYNTAGNTSFGAVGLEWNWDFADGWSFEPGFGYAIHNGTKESPFPQGDPRGDAFTKDNLLLGSNDLFRTSLAINRDFNESWGAQLMYEHLSHGQILGNGRNQGLDNLGVRIYYRFGE